MSVNGYFCVKKETENETVIERSRFISYVKKCETEDDARAFLEEKRKAHPFATHNCYAYITERGKIARFSDDGEPHGTAGKPILSVIEGASITNVCIVVTRYFGGVLLGTGGLVRAYSQGARDVIEKAGTAENVLSRVYGVKMPYDCYQPFLKFVDKIKKSVVSTDFSDSVTVKIAVPYDNADFAAKVTDLTNGKAEITEINSADEEYIVYDDDL